LNRGGKKTSLSKKGGGIYSSNAREERGGRRRLYDYGRKGRSPSIHPTPFRGGGREDWHISSAEKRKEKKLLGGGRGKKRVSFPIARGKGEKSSGKKKRKRKAY